MRPGETPATNIDLLAVEDENLDTIHTWFKAPHVLPWWGEPSDNRNEVAWHRRNRYGDCRLIADDGRPIGYIQWTDLWRWSPNETYGLPQGTIDIDVLIGERDALGLGYGPEAMRQVIALICLAAPPPLFSLFTMAENACAIRAFEKLGFTKRQLIERLDKPDSWLMTCAPISEPMQSNRLA